jgi:hypothetical protein
MRIQCKCLVQIYVFPEMKLWWGLVISKQKYKVLSPNIQIRISVSDLKYSQDCSAHIAAAK